MQRVFYSASSGPFWRVAMRILANFGVPVLVDWIDGTCPIRARARASSFEAFRLVWERLDEPEKPGLDRQ